MKKVLVIMFSFIIIFVSLPLASISIKADTQAKNEETNFGTPGVDYQPGEVIVCVEGGTKALAESGIFSKPFFASINAGGTNDEDFEGLKGNIGSNKVSIEEDIMTFSSNEESVDNIIDENESDQNNQENNINLKGTKGLLGSANEEEYSFVVLKSNIDDVSELIGELNNLPCVKYAEPNYIEKIDTAYTKDDATNEPLFDYQWYSDCSNINGNIDINATNAYENAGFSNQKDVVVAVMDSGVDYTHPDLKDVMWSDGENIEALKELGGGKYGINTAKDEQTEDPMDTVVGHGTHCASTIASTWANNEGIAGVNGHVKIMACRWMSSSGGQTSDFLKAMNYVMEAKKAGVNVVATNNSWGPSFSGAQASKSVALIVEQASELGIVSCFAAGNSALDHDNYTNQSYVTPYILVVGAMNSKGNSAYFSDFGKRTVDVYAPGTQILAATSLEPGVSMQAQYLPWIQPAEDSFFYEDFEDFGNKKVSLESYKYDENEKTKVKDDEVTAPGYISTNSCRIDFANEMQNEDEFALELNISLDDILTEDGKLPESDNYYLSFEAGAENIEFDGISNNVCSLEYCKIVDGKEVWKQPTSNARWRSIDGTWSVSTTNLSNEEMQKLVDAAKTTGDVLKLRLSAEVTNINPGAYFYIDSIGFGTKTSNYYYSDGTSMATPITTAIVSLIAGAGETLPDSSEDVLEVIAKLKGGVKRENTNLADKCLSMGCVQADTAYKNDSQLYPVPENVKISEDGLYATIDGYFFGNANGQVNVNGQNAVVTSWSDRQIVIEIPAGTKDGLLEYSVTRSDSLMGREFGVFVDEKTSNNNYQNIPIADFTYNDIKTKDLVPLRLAANEDGLMAVLKDQDDTEVVLEFYSFESKTWSQVPLPEDMKIFSSILECDCSIVGGDDQFYLLTQFKESDDINLYLLTYSTTENDWIYCIPWNGVYSPGEVLGLDGEGKLYVTCGMRTVDNPKVWRVYPDSGAFDKTPYELPEDCISGAGGDYLISGDMQIIAGINDGTAGRLIKSLLGIYQWETMNPVVLKNGNFVEKETPFFNFKEHSEDGKGGVGPEKDQIFVAAYGALDTGFIMAGPAKGIGTPEMVDTWIYDEATDTYTALEDAKADATRMKAQAGVCRNGTFYVMGKSSLTNELFLKSLDLSLYGVTSTDNCKNAELEEKTANVTALGQIWLDDNDGGYYLVDNDGKLVKEGASEQNYNVYYDSKTNKVTLKNANITDIQDSVLATKKCGVYSIKDLTIELIGDNSIKVSLIDSDKVVDSYGVYSKGNLTIVGDGNLDIKSGRNANNNYGMYSEKSINLSLSGTLNVTGELCDEAKLESKGKVDIGTYAIASKDTVDIGSGNVFATAEAVDFEFIDEQNEPALHESIGIDADKVVVFGDANVTVSSGDVSSLGQMNSIAIRTNNPVQIGKSKITTNIGIMKDYSTQEIVEDGANDNYNRGFNKEPLLMEKTIAKLWYGKDKSKAEDAGNVSFDIISSALIEKYIHIEAEEEINYEIIKGNNISIDLSKNEDVEFVSNAEMSKFLCVLIDDKVLNSKYYSVESGSTIVKVKKEFLKTLSEGKHTISIVSTDGVATTSFEILSGKSDNPGKKEEPAKNEAIYTGDDNNIFSMIVIIAICTSVLGATIIYKKLEENA